MLTLTDGNLEMCEGKWEALCPILLEKWPSKHWLGVLSQTVNSPRKPFLNKTRQYHKSIHHHKPFKRLPTEKVRPNLSLILSCLLAHHQTPVSSFLYHSHILFFPPTCLATFFTLLPMHQSQHLKHSLHAPLPLSSLTSPLHWSPCPPSLQLSLCPLSFFPLSLWQPLH